MKFSVFMKILMYFVLIHASSLLFMDIDDENTSYTDLYLAEDQNNDDDDLHDDNDDDVYDDGDDEMYNDLSLADNEIDEYQVELLDNSRDPDEVVEVSDEIENNFLEGDLKRNEDRPFDFQPVENHQPDTCSQQYPSAPLPSAVDATSGTLLISVLIPIWKQFQFVSDDEITNRLHNLLCTNVDKDNNKLITLNELSEWVLRLFEAECSKYDYGQGDVMQTDINNDNKISWNEIHANFDLTYSIKNGVDEEDKNSWKTKVRLRFNHADKNQDGFLEKDELLRYVAVDVFRDMDDFNIDIFVLDHDKDSNGVITKREFLSTNFIGDEQFKEIDQNSDEVLSRNEILSVVLQETTSGLVRGDVRMMFRSAFNFQYPNYTGNYSDNSAVEIQHVVSVLQDQHKSNLSLINQLLQKQMAKSKEDSFERTSLEYDSNIRTSLEGTPTERIEL